MTREVRRALSWAALAVAFVAFWQILTVQANYAGNWTGLFRIGANRPVPAALDGRVVRNAHPAGYDGQFYLWIALDPTLRSGNAAAVDSPVYRARRVLVPALAWLFSAGQPAAAAAAYVAVIWLCVFGGVYWLARLALLRGLHPAAGLLFLLAPPVLISADSMTVDIALATLSAALLWYWCNGRAAVVFLILAAAPLVRESGALLPAAAVLAALWQRRWLQAVFSASTLLPAAAWFYWLAHSVPPELAAHRDTALVPWWFLRKLSVPLFSRLWNPSAYDDFSPLARLLAQSLDALAILATAAVCLLAVRRLRPFQFTLPQFVLALHLLFVLAMADRWFWYAPYGYTRPFAPLFVLVLAAESPAALRLAALACAVIDLRVLAELQSQFAGVFHWIFG